jgi:hypothetical protein
MLRWVLDLLISWGAVRGGGPAKEVWMVPLCVVWCICREMNAWHFEDEETSMFELRKLLLLTHIWIAAHHSLHVISYANFLNLCIYFFSY